MAEGVEDSAQFLALRRMGCDVGQGFYFGKPMASEEISRLLREDPPASDPKPPTMAQAPLGGRGGSELPPHGSRTAVG